MQRRLDYAGLRLTSQRSE